MCLCVLCTIGTGVLNKIKNIAMPAASEEEIGDFKVGGGMRRGSQASANSPSRHQQAREIGRRPCNILFSLWHLLPHTRKAIH